MISAASGGGTRSSASMESTQSPCASDRATFFWAPKPAHALVVTCAPQPPAIATVSSVLPLSTTMRSSQKATLCRHAAMFFASFLVMMIALSLGKAWFQAGAPGCGHETYKTQGTRGGNLGRALVGKGGPNTAIDRRVSRADAATPRAAFARACTGCVDLVETSAAPHAVWTPAASPTMQAISRPRCYLGPANII